MSKLQIKTRLGWLACISLICGGCATNSAEEESTIQAYTPIALYFNPLEHVCPFELVKYFPIFENYPDDWKKYGLHENPKTVYNVFNSRNWGISYRLEAIFNETGQFYGTVNTAWKTGEEFKYSPEGKIQEIIHFDDGNSHYHDTQQMSTFVYDGSLLKEWRGPSRFNRDLFPNYDIKAYSYEYYPDSTLKAVVPIRKGEISSKSPTGTYEFNDEGLLVGMTAPRSSNPYLKPFEDGFKMNSISEFMYNDKGQCIVKDETIFLTSKKNGQTVTDTLTCISRYVYNKHNDLIEWTYNGTIAEDEGSGVRTVRGEVTIGFDYEYDHQGNWTTAWCIFPKDFESYGALTRFYRQFKDGNGYQTDSDKYDGKLALQIDRVISGYYDEKPTEEASIQEQEKPKDIPKYTGVMAYGLTGPVKMLKNESEKQTTVFNEVGNIEKFISANGYRDCNYTYIYESPTRFKNSDIPYRIDINGNVMRMICEPDEETFEFEDEYEFDSQGRVIKHVWHEGMSPTTREFAYQGDSHLPYKETQSSYDETGDWSATTVYKYIDVDNHGNWIKRIGTVTTVSNEYEEVQNEDGEWESREIPRESTYTVEEVRTITYY